MISHASTCAGQQHIFSQRKPFSVTPYMSNKAKLSTLTNMHSLSRSEASFICCSFTASSMLFLAALRPISSHKKECNCLEAELSSIYDRGY